MMKAFTVLPQAPNFSPHAVDVMLVIAKDTDSFLDVSQSRKVLNVLD